MQPQPEQHPFRLRDDEVPHGAIHELPQVHRRRRTRFAVALPTLATVFVLTALLAAFAVLLGMNDLYVGTSGFWSIYLPVAGVLAIAASGYAAFQGWHRTRRTGPARPLALGLLTGAVLMAFLLAPPLIAQAMPG